MYVDQGSVVARWARQRRWVRRPILPWQIRLAECGRGYCLSITVRPDTPAWIR